MAAARRSGRGGVEGGKGENSKELAVVVILLGNGESKVANAASRQRTNTTIGVQRL